MSEDFRSIGPAISKLQEDMERLNRSLKPSWEPFYAKFDRMMAQIHRQHTDFARGISQLDRESARIDDFIKANQHWQDMIERATASNRLFSDLAKTHETWSKNLKTVGDQIAQIQASTKLSLGGMAFRLTAAERVFSGVDFNAIRLAMALPQPTVLNIRSAIDEMTANYRNLAESIHSYPEVTRLPTFALPGATRELLVASHALDAVCVSDETDQAPDSSYFQMIAEVEEEASVCVPLLEALDPQLARAYIGARDALRGTNPDRARHVLISLREVWSHVLRLIAPDNHVLTWVPRDNNELLHEGRPTRRSRILYVCRGVNHPPLSDFLDLDTNALIEFVDLFNRVHEIKPSFTDEQLRALLLRSDSWLTYILQIAECTG